MTKIPLHFSRLLLAIAGLVLSVCALAQVRNFPADSYQVNLQAFNDPYITITGTSVHLAPGLLIIGQANTTLVRSALPVGAVIRVEFDSAGDVRKIWVLNNSEVVPVSLWQQLFGGAFQPPAHNSP